jgi:hypothetical protein
VVRVVVVVFVVVVVVVVVDQYKLWTRGARARIVQYVTS